MLINLKAWAQKMSAPFEWADGYAVGILPFLYKPLTVRVWTVP